MTDEQYAALIEQTAHAMKCLDHVIKIESLEKRATIRCVNCNGAAAVFSHHPVAMADIRASSTCTKKQFSLFANFME